MGPERRSRADQGKPDANPVAGEEPTETPKPKVRIALTAGRPAGAR